MQTRQLYGAISSTQAGAIYVELPTNARLRSVLLSITPVGAFSANSDYCMVEISTNPANQNLVNDAQGVLVCGGIAWSFTTSGASTAGASFQALMDIQLRAGDRIYLNTTESGGGAYNIRAILQYQ